MKMKKSILLLVLFIVLGGLIWWASIPPDPIDESDLDITNPTYIRISKHIDTLRTAPLNSNLYNSILTKIEDAYTASRVNPLIDNSLKNKLITNADLVFIDKLNSTAKSTFNAGICRDKKLGINLIDKLFRTMETKNEVYKTKLVEMRSHIDLYKSISYKPYRFQPFLDSKKFSIVNIFKDRKGNIIKMKETAVENYIVIANKINKNRYPIINKCLKTNGTANKIKQKLSESHTTFIASRLNTYDGSSEKKLYIRDLLINYEETEYSKKDKIVLLKKLMKSKIDSINSIQIDSLNINKI